MKVKLKNIYEFGIWFLPFCFNESNSGAAWAKYDDHVLQHDAKSILCFYKSINIWSDYNILCYLWKKKILLNLFGGFNNKTKNPDFQGGLRLLDLTVCPPVIWKLECHAASLWTTAASWITATFKDHRHMNSLLNIPAFKYYPITIEYYLTFGAFIKIVLVLWTSLVLLHWTHLG